MQQTERVQNSAFHSSKQPVPWQNHSPQKTFNLSFQHHAAYQKAVKQMLLLHSLGIDRFISEERGFAKRQSAAHYNRKQSYLKQIFSDALIFGAVTVSLFVLEQMMFSPFFQTLIQL